MGPLSDGSTIKTPVVLYHQINVRVSAPQPQDRMLTATSTSAEWSLAPALPHQRLLSKTWQQIDQKALHERNCRRLGRIASHAVRDSSVGMPRRVKRSTPRPVSCWTWAWRRTTARHPLRLRQVSNAALMSRTHLAFKISPGVVTCTCSCEVLQPLPCEPNLHMNPTSSLAMERGHSCAYIALCIQPTAAC